MESCKGVSCLQSFYAVKKLKACNHPYYQDIEVDYDFMNNKVNDTNELDNDLSQEEATDDCSDEDTDDESKDPVKKYQSKQDSYSSC